MIEESDILYKDEFLIAVNKPPGLLVHRTSLTEEDKVFALQQVRDILNQRVYPIHRLDRPTSGVLVFGLDSEAAAKMHQLFIKKEIRKTYIALTRGWLNSDFIFLNHPVKNGKGGIADARTDFYTLENFELPFGVPPYETSRYSVLEVRPATGRWHQIRQHLAHLRHYIINDRVHGTGAHNKMFTEVLGLADLFLHARRLEFTHPYTGDKIIIDAKFPKHWTVLRRIISEQAIFIKNDFKDNELINSILSYESDNP